MIRNRIVRLPQKLAFLTWGLGCVAASILIDGYQALETFQGQKFAVRFGAYLGLLAFATAAVFCSYLMISSLRTKSIEEPMGMLPWASKTKAPSLLAFRATCVVCAAAFLVFCALFLSIILE